LRLASRYVEYAGFIPFDIWTGPDWEHQISPLITIMNTPG
jgi:hypothetical protein